MDQYFEGDDCPFCDAEYNDFFQHSDGMGSYSDLVHYYYCDNIQHVIQKVLLIKTE